MEDSVRLDVHCKSSLLLSPLIYYVTRAKLNCSVNFNIKDCFMYFARVSSSHFLSLFLSISLFYVLPLYRGLFAFIWKTERNDAARSHDSIDQDPPEVGIALGSNINGDDVKEGDDLYIECHIRANPSFHKLQWTHNVSRKKRKYIFVLFFFFCFVLSIVEFLSGTQSFRYFARTLAISSTQQLVLNILSRGCWPLAAFLFSSFGPDWLSIR